MSSSPFAKPAASNEVFSMALHAVFAHAVKPGTKLKTDTRKAVKNQKFMAMLDSTLQLADEAEQQSISEFVTLALECLDEAADERPSFGRLLAALEL
ncbi:hypothetical protein CAOG_009299 [Capsaspora owczarzaki ATCC 30864]|uniref:Serine-threonine/tyrosine-protein kinase catalytic domain-containing protein n=1 Tax=Capsaspora owczarzaki (strain ATCC 30864) TaxID=595528 RepID=A0A0D2WIF0_CAPO3|nr:hypothetical protein CAOG_009298 [Capsaspora owczarzaki ATCC 30864]KJE88788.1 hypothetical protein CAOG_009299 [Capsaspora owczarzaki ATCC 30864]